MAVKLLCDIPIYGISKEKYNKKFNKEKTKYYKWMLECSHGDQEISQIATQNKYLPFSVWKYNQMDGFIEIEIQNGDVVFKLYMADIKHHICFSFRKKYYNYIPTVGLHFWTHNKNNEEIIKEIYYYIEMIKKDFIYISNVYFDTTILENIIKYMDLKKFIEE